jgi:hypothetical protein
MLYEYTNPGRVRGRFILRLRFYTQSDRTGEVARSATYTPTPIRTYAGESSNCESVSTMLLFSALALCGQGQGQGLVVGC